MLELVVGAAALVLLLAGMALIAGPVLPRAWRTLSAAVRRRGGGSLARVALPINQPASTGEPALHPTTLQALTAAARASSLLNAGGGGRVAAELRAGARRVRTDEAQGLLALAALLPALREVSLDDPLANARYQRLVRELREAVKDRSEQLELLHFR